MPNRQVEWCIFYDYMSTAHVCSVAADNQIPNVGIKESRFRIQKRGAKCHHVVRPREKQSQITSANHLRMA